MSLLVVCPFFYGDEHLLLNNLAWIKELDERLDYDCLLAYDDQTNPAAGVSEAQKVFRSVKTLQYKRTQHSHWPFPQNHAFLNVAWHVQATHKGAWFWCETDSIPTRPGWLDALWAEYQKGGKPFGGHWNPQTNVFNGVGIYPADISRYSTDMMMAGLVDAKDAAGKPYQPPWDFYGSKQVRKHLHVMNDLMQHIWQNDATGEAWAFPDKVTVEQVIRPGVVLFHRCKNESLISRLREAHGTTVQDAMTADVVSLRRNGDIISLLPLLHRMAGKLGQPVKLAVMREYAPLLHGVSYVDAVPCDGDMEDPLSVASRLNAVNAQVFGKRLRPDTQRENFVHKAWSMIGYKWDRYAPLVFDKRDKTREGELAAQVFKTEKPKVLVKLDGISSPFRDGHPFWNALVTRCGASVEIVDLAGLHATRLYDLLGLIDRAACLVTVDTCTAHLAQGSMCPVIQLVNDTRFGATPERGNCIFRVPYRDALKKIGYIVGLVTNCAMADGNQEMVLVFNYWKPHDAETQRRQDRAYETWLKFPARLHAFSAARTSEQFGDKRKMPFVRDLIVSGFSGSEDVLVISNNDIKFDERLAQNMQQSIAHCGCWWAYRTEHQGGPTDQGADVFAFTRKWWTIHQDLFPDFLLGYWWWDDMMVRLMRWSGCREQGRLYYHEPHLATQSPARQHDIGARHNERLANEWLRVHDERREKPT